MSSETLSYFFKNEDIKLKARFQVALQCAPFLKGLKISSVITMEQKMCEELSEIFEETGVEYRILSCRDGRCLVFFFRRSELEYHLMLPDNQRLLEAYGYHMRNLDEMLKRLAQSVRQISSRKLGFPHEIGVFLGYPKEDVEGFIQNEGRKYLMIGYWKVYSNPEKARMIFLEYARAKVCAVNEYLDGKNIREIALMQRKWRNL